MDTPIAYTTSQLLQQYTTSIDHLRIRILSIPLLPQKELALRSHTTHIRILTALRHAHIPMTPLELNRLLLSPPKRPHPMEQEALLYRQALAYIRDEWTGQTDPFTRSHIEVLMHISLRYSFPRISRIVEEHSKDIQRLLAYIDASHDHPILLAGIVYATIAHTPLHDISQGRITLLITSLMMARFGYDVRGMLSFESSLLNDPKTYLHALSSITSYGQMTIWLEYFSEAVVSAYNDLLIRVEATQKRPTTTLPFALLNTRQKHVLLLLETHGARVTNRDIQKRFHISQITASRDLAKLVFSGFIQPHGKGRSVSYTLA